MHFERSGGSVKPTRPGVASSVLVAGFSVVQFVRRSVVSFVALSVSAVLAGCAQDGALTGEGLALQPLVASDHPRAPDTITQEIETGALPEAVKLVTEGKLQFAQGHYGLAIDAFSKSIERDALNAQSWLGLAASYDQTGRFDQADKAYGKAQELVGATPSLLNNLGYSYMLRGNLDKARQTLASAYAGDPGNPYIKNNIALLERSAR